MLTVFSAPFVALHIIMFGLLPSKPIIVTPQVQGGGIYIGQVLQTATSHNVYQPAISIEAPLSGQLLQPAIGNGINGYILQ